MRSSVQQFDDMIDCGIIDEDYESVKQSLPPIRNQNKHVVDEVIKDMALRKKMGIKKYGTPLQPHNGRSALQDALEEAMDLVCYLKQRVMEEEKAT